MIRKIFASLAALLIAPVLIGAAPAKDWTKTISRTADGAYVVGNPQAKVKLVEYLSYTCPHCAHYSVASTPVLKGQYVRSGSTRVEFRHATRDPIDLAATIAARCAGPAGFAAMTEQLFATQADWLPRAMRFEQTNAARMALYSTNAKLRAIADGAGFTDLAKARGVSAAALDACYNDDAQLALLATMSDASWATIAKVAGNQPAGTPTFIINAKPYVSIGWPEVQKALIAAGAK